MAGPQVPSDPRCDNPYEYLIDPDKNFIFDLEEVYGLKWSTQGFLNEYYTVEEAEVKFKYLFEWARFNGWDDETIMLLRHFPACWHDAMWAAKSWRDYDTDRSGGIVQIIAPPGKFPTNYHCWFGWGNHEGAGSFGFYTGGGTVVVCDHNNWIGNGPHNQFMTISSDVTWEGSDQMFTAWVESSYFKGFRLNGAKPSEYYDQNLASTGLVLQGHSECCFVDNVYAENFNDYGFELNNTPGSIGIISSFSNNLGAVGWDGGNGLSNTRIGLLSCDDNPTAIRIRPTSDSAYSGGTLTVDCIKSETNARQPFKQQIILDAQGQTFINDQGESVYKKCRVNIHFNQITYAASWAKSHAPFVLDVDQYSHITVANFVGWGYDALVHDIRNKKHFSGGQYYKGLTFDYDLIDGGRFTAKPLWDGEKYYPSFTTNEVPNPGGVERYAGRRWEENGDGTGQWSAYDFEAGTTKYVYDRDPFEDAPPPDPACEWQVGQWSDCEGGEQFREVRLLQEPCQGDPGPEPASTRTCDLPPPGDSVNVLLVHNNITKANAYKAHYDQFDLYNIQLLEYDVYNGSNLGCITNDSFNALKSTIDTDHPTVEWVILLDERVFRAGQQNNFYGHNSITGALKSGIHEYQMTTSGTIIGPLRENPLWDYIGNKPLTDKGNRGYSLLSWDAFENNKNNFKGVETGLWWHWLYGNRGGYRKPTCQDAAQLPLVDGVNNLYEEFSGWEDREVHDQQNVLTVVNGMYKFELDNTNTYKPGGIFSNLTSYGGALDGKTPRNQPSNQTPITQLLKHGYAGAEGAIREPWVTGQTSGDTPAQFLDPVRLGERFFSGMSIQQIMHSSIQKDDLILIMGDPLYIPYGEYTPPTDVYGCTDPEANNFNPLATIDDGSCTYDPPPVDGLVWETNFADSDGKYLRSAQGDLGPFKYGLNWANEVSEDGMNVRDYNQWVDCDIEGVNKVVLAADLTSMNSMAIFHTADSYLRWSGQKESFVIGVNNIECAHTYVDGVYTISLPLDCDLVSLMGPNPMIGLWRYIRLLHTEI